MKLFEDLKYRELFYDTTDPNIENILNNEKVSFYIGADPTADSLHIGHLLGYITAKRLQNAGHKPVLVIGGATGLIGDPSGKSKERDLLDIKTTLHYSDCIAKQVKNIINAEVVNNYDWTKSIDMITFLRDYGKNFNINIMMSKDSVKSRLETGISFTEFSYQIIQSMDFLHLYKEKNVTLQCGGQDQWGNIVAGTELIRKQLGSDVKVYGFTWPLVTKSDGTKFGKSETGTVWLDAKKTTPYEFYQFWINTPDADVIKRLKQFTFLTKSEIGDIEKSFNSEPHLRLAQKTLAKEVTTIIHGTKSYEQAVKISESLFSGNIKELTVEEIEMGFKGLPTIDLKNDMLLVDCLIESKLAQSKRESREFITNNAVSINGDKVNDLEYIVSKNNAIEKKFTLIKRGKKKYSLVKHI